MTSKTHMFLVMMVAATTLSLGFTPAFAHTETQTYKFISGVQPNETITTGTTDLHCVGGVDRCGGYLEVDNEGYEWVKSHYYIGGGASCM